MGVGAAAAEMATLETRKFENASPREEHPSVPGNHQPTAEVQQVRDKRDSTEKGVVLTQVMEQDVEKVKVRGRRADTKGERSEAKTHDADNGYGRRTDRRKASPRT